MTTVSSRRDGARPRATRLAAAPGAVALSLALSALALSTAGVASAQSDGSSSATSGDAQRLYMRAAAAYGDERYAEAALLFAQAYEFLGEASLLYNLGLARERAGDVAGAIEAYERYLADAPDASERTDVERSLETLRRQEVLEEELARRDSDDASDDDAEMNVPVPAASTPDAAGGTATGPLPWIVAGTGVAGVAVGIALGAVAQSSYDAARTEPTHRRATELERSANELGTGANVALAVGGTLALGGVIWGIVELVTAGGPRPDERALRLDVGPGTIVVAGSF